MPATVRVSEPEPGECVEGVLRMSDLPRFFSRIAHPRQEPMPSCLHLSGIPIRVQSL